MDDGIKCLFCNGWPGMYQLTFNTKWTESK